MDLDFTFIAETDVPRGIDEESMATLAAHVLAAEEAVGRWLITVVLMSDREIKQLHQKYMGIDTGTDVLTFPYDENESSVARKVPSPILGGDIVISVDQAARQASEDGWDVAEEIRFLVCHGMLHLLGWDDSETADREAMLNRQRELLRGLRERRSVSESTVTDR